MKHALAATLLLALAPGARANDAVGTVAAGGIVLRKTDAIAMKKEVLTVGHEWITVDYEFLNESGTDVEETVVFPMPVYPAAQQVADTYYGQPGGFTVAVDGKPVPARTEVRALLGRTDVTAQLKNAGLSEAQIAYGDHFGDRVKVAPLGAPQRRQLEQLGLYGTESIGEPAPQWAVQVNYVWQQVFPANRIVRVHHAYRPMVGTGPGEWILTPGTKQQYCMDAAFLKSWHRLATKTDAREFDYLPASKVAYILRSGNSWKRGIEDFTLNIVKSDPGELVSLCFPGTVRKIDATTFQVKLRNFQPAADLDVYFGNLKSADPQDGEAPRLRHP